MHCWQMRVITLYFGKSLSNLIWQILFLSVTTYLIMFLDKQNGDKRDTFSNICMQMCYRGGLAWSYASKYVWEEVWPEVRLPAWRRVHLWIQLCHHLLHKLLHVLCLFGSITCTLTTGNYNKENLVINDEKEFSKLPLLYYLHG